MMLTTPMNKSIFVNDDGSIEGDFENLAGWVRSGSRRDEALYMRWFLFLKEWERQRLKEEVLRKHDIGWQDLLDKLVGKT